MGDLRDGGIMSVVWRPAEGKWRVRIAVDNGLVVESKAAYDTADEAKAAGNAWCKQNGVRTEIAQ